MDIYTLSVISIFFKKENLIAVNGGKTALLKWSLSSFFQLYLFDYCTLYNVNMLLVNRDHSIMSVSRLQNLLNNLSC